MAAFLPALVLAAACSPFDLGFGAGVLMGAAAAFVLFGITGRAFRRAVRTNKVRRSRMLLAMPLKVLVTAAALFLAARVSAAAVAGLFAGVAAALAGTALAAGKGD